MHELTQSEQVIGTLRERILSGKFEPGRRLMEEQLAQMLGASRTPVRLALGVLEQERLVVANGPRRGFTVNSFSLEEVFDAIEARGTLEGMGARLAAERGLTHEAREVLRACVERGRELLASGVDSELSRKAWVRNNVDFHAAVVTASGNRAIAPAIEQISHVPLASAAAIVLQTQNSRDDARRLERAQADHADLLAALEAGQGSRAEMLMREHANLNIRNKRENFTAIKARNASGDLPGLGLVALPPRAVAQGTRGRRARGGQEAAVEPSAAAPASRALGRLNPPA